MKLIEMVKRGNLGFDFGSYCKIVIMTGFLMSLSFSANAQIKKIVVTPSDAKIYVDGNYVADGSYDLKLTRKNDFFLVKAECPGYVTKNLKVFRTDQRRTIAITLTEDDSFLASEESDLANHAFTIQVREGVSREEAWRVISQVLLNYYDEFQTSDRASGYINTAWEIKKFPQSDVRIRTRVQVKEISSDGLAYQIKIFSEIAPIKSSDEAYKEWNRVLKKYQPLINELTQRVGKF